MAEPIEISNTGATKDTIPSSDEEGMRCALVASELVLAFSKSMVLKAVVLLDVPDIIAKAGPGAVLSLEEIAAQLPSESVDIHCLLRVMRAAVVYGIFRATHLTSDSGKISTRYALNGVSKLFVKHNSKNSFPKVLSMVLHKVTQAPWHHLHESVLYGKTPFTAAHGTNAWDYTSQDPEYSTVFHAAMVGVTSSVTNKIVQYDGFKDIKTLVDVGGGTGQMLADIVKAHPHIHGVLFDMPHVVATAPTIPGVEQVGGNMFESIPSSDAIIIKMILHDWDDDRCGQILENCEKALPANGRLIIAEQILPSEEDDNLSNPAASRGRTVARDLLMMTQTEGGKERTEEQYRHILAAAGFQNINLVQLTLSNQYTFGIESLIEAYKS